MDRPQTASDIRALICAELGRAVSERGHGWRTAVLASCDNDGVPQARTVVLRAVSSDASELQIYTDRRSPKVRELLMNPRASMVFWCPQRRWQLRLSGAVEILTDGPLIRTAWSAIRGTATASDYLTPEPPGTPITGLPQLADVEHQLAILLLRVNVIDWLELHPDGHRRARLSADQFEWVTP